MKKILSILGTITLISTGTTSLISCSNKVTDDNESTDEPAAAKDEKF